MMRALRRLIHRRKQHAPVCTWAGRHSDEGNTVVYIGWRCGHQDAAAFTCTRHLSMLVGDCGRATHASPCPVCGTRSIARVTSTADAIAAPA